MGHPSHRRQLEVPRRLIRQRPEAGHRSDPTRQRDVSKSPPVSDKAEVKDAEPGPVATARNTDNQGGQRDLLLVSANERLTDQEVKALLESIEKKRSAFEAALDDKLKNSTIKGERGEVNTNEFFDDLQDQVQRARERFSSDYSASSEVLSLLQFATRLDAWASTQPAGFRGSREWGALATDFRRLAAAYNSAPAQARTTGAWRTSQAAQRRRARDRRRKCRKEHGCLSKRLRQRAGRKCEPHTCEP